MEKFFRGRKNNILLDDGGHTNENQILTLNNIINNVNDNGLIVPEDTSSYSKKHFNPSKYSFINYSKFLIDDLYGRDEEKFNLYGVIKQKSLNKHIYSIKFFNSIVAFLLIERTVSIKECFKW